MVGKLAETINGEQVAMWLIIAFLVAYFLYKEFPEFKKRISKSAIKETVEEMSEKTLSERLKAIEDKLAELDEKTEKRFSEMNEKLTSDYNRINSMEKEQQEFKRMQRGSLKERGIIMRALLALMDGSPDNELIRKSEQEINEYLITQAHQPGE